MFEDILDGFKDLEDELEKDAAQLGLGVPEVEPDLGDWDTGGGDAWDTDQRTADEDTVWST